MSARESLHILAYVSSMLLSWKIVVSVPENRQPSVEFSAILKCKKKASGAQIFKNCATIYVVNWDSLVSVSAPSNSISILLKE